MMELLLKYEEQKRKVACLEFQIKEFSSPLTILGNAIKADFERVMPSQDDDNRFIVSAPASTGRQEQVIEIDLARLRVLLGDYMGAVSEMEQTEACMERGGMVRFIRS